MRYLFFIAEIIALIAGIYSFNKIRKTFLVLFIPFLLITIVYEYGSFSGWFIKNNRNLWAANLFTTFEFLFYLTIFLFVFIETRIKRYILFSTAALLVFFIINISSIQGFLNLNSYTIIAGSLLIIGWCGFAFFKILTTEECLILIKYPIFWICTGLFIFYLSQFALMLYINHIIRSENYQYADLFIAISNISNVVLYSCIAIGLTCTNPPLKRL